MESGSLRHIITIQEQVQVSDGMGGFVSTWVDYHTNSDWTATTAYELGDLCAPTTKNSYYYIVTVAGTSDAAEPTFPTIVGNTVVDNTVTWTCKSPKTRASIWPLRANEQIENMKVDLKVTHRIRIRYLSGVTTAMRIKFGDRYFNLTSQINENERNRTLEFLAEETV
jgi:SPP1 family predicted phage head-tail adaptor